MAQAAVQPTRATMGFTARPVMSKPRRSIYVGGKDASRTPLYETPHQDKDKHECLVDSEGRDCYAVSGRFIGIRVFRPKGADGSPKMASGKEMRKLAIGFDMGDEVCSIITGLGTNTSLSIVSVLAYFYGDRPLPEYLSITFRRGSKNPNVIFAQVHTSEDCLNWEYLNDSGSELRFERDGSTKPDDYVETMINMIHAK